MPGTTRRITFFRVPPADDDAFVAGWEHSRDATLYRALREDVAFRFVEIAPGGGPPLYDVAYEDGVPDGTQGVVLIEAFAVAPDADEPFVAGWRDAHALLAAQPGYQGARLHRARSAADFRFVEIARWSSPLGFSKAIRRAAARPLTAPSHPALYLVVGR